MLDGYRGVGMERNGERWIGTAKLGRVREGWGKRGREKKTDEGDWEKGGTYGERYRGGGGVT